MTNRKQQPIAFNFISCTVIRFTHGQTILCLMLMCGNGLAN